MSELMTQPAFGGMKTVSPPISAPGAGVQVRLMRPAMVSVLARKDKKSALREEAKSTFGLDLFDAPMRGSAGAITALGLGPGRWLFLGAAPDALQAAFTGLASLSDHSDGYAVFEIRGSAVRRTLAKGVPLDLELFKDTDVAVTSVAHIGAIVWRNDDGGWIIAVFRSYAASFWHWLEASAGEFGLAVEGSEESI
jgi:heterotetrameric sarcosine oxidase gamma subunit